LNSGKKSTAVLYFAFLLLELDYTNQSPNNKLLLRKGISEKVHEAIKSFPDTLDRNDIGLLYTSASIFLAYHEEQLGADLTNVILSKTNVKDSAPFLKRIKDHLDPSQSKLLARIEKALRELDDRE
jgi:hypothetical protein